MCVKKTAGSDQKHLTETGNAQLLGRQSPKCFKYCSSCTKMFSETTLYSWFLKHIEQNATITSVYL